MRGGGRARLHPGCYTNQNRHWFRQVWGQQQSLQHCVEMGMVKKVLEIWIAV